MLEDVKMLLGINGAEKDNILKFIIDDCKSRALSYCRRTDMPEEMQSLIVAMAVRAYRVCGYGNETEPDTVTSFKQGDRSETYEDGSVKRDDWINDFKDRLEPFRLRKGKVPSEIKNS